MPNVIALDVIHDAMDNAGIERANLRTDYSGRMMYGERCMGISVTYVSEILRFAAHLGAADADLADDLMDNTRSDSLGKSDTIYYWPAWTTA